MCRDGLLSRKRTFAVISDPSQLSKRACLSPVPPIPRPARISGKHWRPRKLVRNQARLRLPLSGETEHSHCLTRSSPGRGGGGNRPSPVAEVVSPLGMNRCRDIRSMANGKGEWPQMVPKTRPYRGYRNPAGADASPLRRACSSPGSREPREIRLGIPKSIFRADDTELTDHAQER